MAEDERVGARIGALAATGWVPSGPAGDVPGEPDRVRAPDPAPGTGPGQGPAPEEAGALRDRALRVALDTYVAAHGHPLDHPTGPTRTVRWVPSRRLVLTVAGVLAVVVAVTVGRPLVMMPSADVPARAVGSEGDHPAGSGAGPDAPGADDGAAPGAVVDDGTGAGGEATAAPGAREVVVHVVGAVGTPGLVRLADGARVADALEAAGGPAPDADLTAVNLARTVVDGEQIHVPVPGEASPAPPSGPVASTGAGGAPLDVNRADAAALEELPGVGPVLAERIVAWRTEHGPFRTVDDLGEVSGIGAKVLEGLRDHVRVGGG